MPRQKDCFSLQNAARTRQTVMTGERMGVEVGSCAQPQVTFIRPGVEACKPVSEPKEKKIVEVCLRLF